MPTLDNDFNIIDEGSVSFMPTATRYGLIGGAALIVLTLLSYIVFIPAGGSMMWAGGMLPFIAYIAMIVMAIRFHRDQELGGYATLGRCIGLGTLTLMIALLLNSIFNYVYTTFIDPEVMNQALDATRGIYESLGMDEDEVDELMEEAKANQPGAMVTMGMTLFFGAITGLVFSAIIGLIMRKNPPQMA